MTEVMEAEKAEDEQENEEEARSEEAEKDVQEQVRFEESEEEVQVEARSGVAEEGEMVGSGGFEEEVEDSSDEKGDAVELGRQFSSDHHFPFQAQATPCVLTWKGTVQERGT